MRGWLFSAALFLSLLTTPLWAQRGGGGHGGMGGGHMGGGFSGGGHAGGTVSGGGHAVVPGAGNAYHGGVSGGWHGNGWHGNGWNGNGWHGNNWNGGWNSNGWNGRHYPYRAWGWGGYGWGSYPYWGWGTSLAFYPGWDWYGDAGAYDPSLAYDDSNPGQPYAPVYPSTVYLAPNGTVEYSQNTQPSGPANPPAPPASPKMTEIHYDTVLVYRDGHTETVENYAVVGKTVWVFTELRARKIPLSALDVPATQRDNQDRGNDFVVPGASQ
jgi:hypothetical protein